MPVYRYEIVSPQRVGQLNKLLCQGWRPVRESPLAREASSNEPGAALVVLEREEADGEAALPEGVTAEGLAEVPILAGLTPSELGQIVGACELIRFEAGEAVFQQGEETRNLYILLEGEVKIVIAGLPLDDMEITGIAAPSAFGESTFFNAAPHTGTAECVQPGRALKLTRGAYEALVQEEALAAYKMAENAAEKLAANLQDADQWVWELLKEEQSGQIAKAWHRYRDRIHSRLWT